MGIIFAIGTALIVLLIFCIFNHDWSPALIVVGAITTFGGLWKYCGRQRLMADPPKKTVRWILNLIYIFVGLCIFAGLAFGPTTPPSRSNRWALTMQSRNIGLSLNQYAIDHNGHYPEGKSSTEVFQHLLDEKYVDDPSVFYAQWVHMPGKVWPQSNQLKPENVCWDVTRCVDSSGPDGLPLVFLSGYRITYQSGSRAMPLLIFPPVPPRAYPKWWDWVYGAPDTKPFNAFCYLTNISTEPTKISARAVEADEDGSIPNFIPLDFDSKGKLYQQLTPDGIIAR